MPSVYLRLVDLSAGYDDLKLSRPVFISVADLPDAAYDRLAVGAGIVFLDGLTDLAPGPGDGLAVSLVPFLGFPMTDEGESLDRLSFLPRKPPNAPELLLSDLALSGGDSLAASRLTVFRPQLDLMPPPNRLIVGSRLFPIIREPGPGEQRGTINLIANPSAELSLDGWNADAGLTLTRSTTDPWAGLYSVECATGAGAALLSVTIAGVAGLYVEDDRQWIGSVAAAGDLANVTLSLNFAYADGTHDAGVNSGGGDTDPDDEPEIPGPDWTRLTSIPFSATPGKVLLRIDLVVSIQQTGAAQTFSLDGAQIEESNVSPYADGDQGAGYYWLGIPHASPSVRETMP